MSQAQESVPDQQEHPPREDVFDAREATAFEQELQESELKPEDEAGKETTSASAHRESEYYQGLAAWEQQFARYPTITDHATFLALHERYRRRDKVAFEQIVYGNRRLVIKVGLMLYHGGMPFADYLQEGMLGLMTAVEKYDPALGFRFSTYAVWWIRQSFQRALLTEDSRSAVRLPVYLHDKANVVRRAERELSHKVDHRPTNYEVWECARQESSVGAENLTLVDVAVVRKLMRDNTVAYSLDDGAPRDDGEEGEARIQHLPDTALDTDNFLRIGGMLRAVDTLLHDLEELVEIWLSRRDRIIVELYFDANQTLEEIGGRFNVSRERIRQLVEFIMQELQARGISLSDEEIRGLYNTRLELRRLLQGGNHV